MLRFFKPKFTSGDMDDVNFYFEAEQLGVSDNHRMAYWFFAKNMTPSSTLFHVDTHLDCSFFRETDRDELVETNALGSIEQFVEHQYPADDIPTSLLRPSVHWGNWIPALLDMHPCLLKRVKLICHNKAGQMMLAGLPCIEETGEECLWSPDGLDATHACLSIDIDYYFTSSDREYRQRSEPPDPMHHFQRLLLRHSRVPLFIALSPSCCGGWHNVLPFVDYIDQTFNLTLREQIERRL